MTWDLQCLRAGKCVLLGQCSADSGARNFITNLTRVLLLRKAGSGSPKSPGQVLSEVPPALCPRLVGRPVSQKRSEFGEICKVFRQNMEMDGKVDI